VGILIHKKYALGNEEIYEEMSKEDAFKKNNFNIIRRGLENNQSIFFIPRTELRKTQKSAAQKKIADISINIQYGSA